MKKRGELSNGLPPDDESGGGDYKPRPNGLDRTTELELIDAALLDNVHAFSELFEHYRPALYGLCRRRLNDPLLAEDVVQEVFLKAFKKLPSYERRKPVWPWLSTIAYRMCVDLQRHRALTQYFADLGVAVDEDAETHGHTRSALDEVMAAEERAELWRAVRVLPKRQRRALLLYALDGLSYADIAAAEGISIGAVKLLIVRARRKMRSSSQSGPLPAIVFPFTWCRWKLQRIEGRVRPLLGVYTEGFSAACVQAACLGTVVMVAVTTILPNQPFDGNDASSSDETILLATQSQTLQAASPNVVVSSKAPVESQQSAAEPSGSLTGYVVKPNQSATPETTTLRDLTISPNYESDHTILTLGYYPNTAGLATYVLFASYDGGASWKPLPSRLLSAYAVALPPDYPQDRRIFALGDLGLQRSDDWGEIFRTVNPTAVWTIAGFNLAISPSFGKGKGDSRILMGGKTLLEYDADTGINRPGLLAIPPSRAGIYHHIAFSPSYESDSTVFITDNRSKGNLVTHNYDQSTLYRCKGSVCDEVQLPFQNALTLRLSPRFDQDGLTYAYTYTKFLFSNDGARTFQEIQIPLLDRAPGRIKDRIKDVAVLWNTSSDPAIFVSVDGFQPSVSGVYHSPDAGRSWNRTWIDFPGFSNGAEKLIVTPTGRLLATGTNGIACSEDKGQTWAPRCTPEQ